MVNGAEYGGSSSTCTMVHLGAALMISRAFSMI